MSKTVVGLFSTVAQAQQVKQALSSNGYKATVIGNGDDELSVSGSSASTVKSTAEGIGEKVGGFFRNLTGGDEAAHTHYATGVNQGGALVAVTVNDPQAAEVAELLTQQGAREIENEGTYAESSAGTSTAANIAQVSGDTVIPVVEEQLVVGKREVDRGGVRVYSHVTERPVNAEIALHEERISVERRPVNRPATAADFQAGSGGVIELTASGEEAVVGKTSRVVEEVSVGKQSSEHTQTVHDTVRKTEVEVEQLAGTVKQLAETDVKKSSY